MAVGFGVFVPQGWKMELSEIDGAAAKWAKAKEIALLAEAKGYDSVWVYDHFHNVPKPAHEAVFECWTTMAALAEATTTIRLGQMVSCALYRAPALVAKITSTIDVISGGRLEWGIGAGWYRNEFAGYGFGFPEPKDRIGMMAETVEIVRSMWTQPETSYQGRYFQLDRAQCDPKPLQDPHPPIWIGGGGEQLTLRAVARLADRANFGGKPDEFAAKREVLKGHCKAVGRDEEEIGKTWSPDLVVRETEAELAGFTSMWNEPTESWAAGNLVGTPEQLCEKLARYVELGCSYVVPWCRDYPDTESLSLFADKVMPEFRHGR
ncbi:MAG: TIGR03560 family F420-dependent LLM class oxidoreductase [Acidimicrobiia bacterium]